MWAGADVFVGVFVDEFVGISVGVLVRVFLGEFSNSMLSYTITHFYT